MSEIEKFTEKLKNIKPFMRDISTKNKRGESHRVKQFIFVEKDKKIEIDWEFFSIYLKSIGERFYIAQYCLKKLKEECEVRELRNSEEVVDYTKKMENETYSIDFICRCEYFIFAIISCLDTIALILNKIYQLHIQDRKTSIKNVKDRLEPFKDQDFPKFILRSYDAWIDEIVCIRNNMTHKQILGFSSQINHNFKEQRVTYTQRKISIRDTFFKEIIKNLPVYFEDIETKMESCLKEFYKWLNTFNYIGRE